MKQLIIKNKFFLLLFLAITIFSCEKEIDAELPVLVASFTHNINEETGAVSFINLSENADSYSWDFGDGTSSTEINPIRSFPSGTYTIVLTARNAAGASDTFEDVIVIDIPLPINLPLTFDDPNVNYEFTTFNGVSFEIVDNPDLSGTNPDASKVGAITNGGAAFEGLFFDVGMQVDLTTLKSVKANFWSDAPVDVLLKLEEGTGADVETTASHMGTGWEEIRFDLSSGEKFSRVTLFVDGPGTAAGTFYIDDIEQTETPAAVGPQTAAPTPPSRDAGDVISLYSDAYTSVNVSEWSTSWDDADNEELAVEGNNIRRINFGDNGGFLGVDFSADAFDATEFTHFHMDYWVADEITSGQVLNPKWSNHENGAEVNAFEYTNAVAQSGEWVSL
ncbi:MAG: PKD domain-containing protein, partial [Bacteroidota bacterium]